MRVEREIAVRLFEISPLRTRTADHVTVDHGRLGNRINSVRRAWARRKPAKGSRRVADQQGQSGRSIAIGALAVWAQFEPRSSEKLGAAVKQKQPDIGPQLELPVG